MSLETGEPSAVYMFCDSPTGLVSREQILVFPCMEAIDGRHIFHSCIVLALAALRQASLCFACGGRKWAGTTRDDKVNCQFLSLSFF